MGSGVAVVERIVSGGQTGVDRAGLDAALDVGIDAGGWCPAGRLAEDGLIPDRYPVTELASPEYAVRTERNVIDSDATLVLNRGMLVNGTLLTVELARHRQKPVLVIQLDDDPDTEEVLLWLHRNRVRCLNVAGPRESKRPGIYGQSLRFLCRLLSEQRRFRT